MAQWPNCSQRKQFPSRGSLEHSGFTLPDLPGVPDCATISFDDAASACWLDGEKQCAAGALEVGADLEGRREEAGGGRWHMGGGRWEVGGRRDE